MAAPPAAMGTLCSRASAALALAVAAAHALFAPLLHVQRVVAALGAEIAGDRVDLGGRRLIKQQMCRDDCPGLCSECGARLADDPEHHHDVADPRWAALQWLAPTE